MTNRRPGKRIRITMRSDANGRLVVNLDEIHRKMDRLESDMATEELLFNRMAPHMKPADFEEMIKMEDE